mmetsp:Transcript_22822/g.30428  ORF Transcript_22822/g.30428 Transcript_22822/m.30428 type:complete len:112 (-) Transcript_22822:607-942(-)
MLPRQYFLGQLGVSCLAPCRPWAVPANIVLARLENELNSLQDVRNVIDSPFLNAQVADSFIEIEHLVGGRLEQIDETFGQLDQAVFLSTFFVLTVPIVESLLVWVIFLGHH